mgnify:CR=1 FL=1
MNASLAHSSVPSPNSPRRSGDAQLHQEGISAVIQGADGAKKYVTIKGDFSKLFKSETAPEQLNDFFDKYLTGVFYSSLSKRQIEKRPTFKVNRSGQGASQQPSGKVVEHYHEVGGKTHLMAGGKKRALLSKKGGVALYRESAQTVDVKTAAHKILTQFSSTINNQIEYKNGLLERWNKLVDDRTPFGSGGFLVNCKAFRTLLDQVVGKKKTGALDDRALVDHFYLPASVNLWHHRLARVNELQPATKTLPANSGSGHASRTGHEERGRPHIRSKSLLRGGAIYDNRCGLYSSADLKHFQSNTKDREQEVQRITTKLRPLKEDYEHGDQKAGKKVFAYENALKTLSAIDKTLDERQVILRTQYLTVLWEHLKEKQGNFNGGDFSIAQLSLLNPSVSKISGSWTHFEDVEIQEMHSLFSEMDEAPLQFDEIDAPFIEDREDLPPIIHVPQALCDNEKVRPTRLRSHFINVDVQMLSISGKLPFLGSLFKKYAKKGKFLSDNLSSGLRNLLNQDDVGSEILSRHRNGESSYKLATDVLRYLDAKGIALGVNCQSGKDRTGIVCESFMQQELLKDVSDAVEAKVKVLETLDKQLYPLRTTIEHLNTLPKPLSDTQEEELKQKIKEHDQLEKKYIENKWIIEKIAHSAGVNKAEHFNRYSTAELRKALTALPLGSNTIASQIIAYNCSDQKVVKVAPHKIFSIDASLYANTKSFFAFLGKYASSQIRGEKAEV